MAKNINIAIDGYSSCGKSTLAKQLAKSLKYVYIDSGAMYRAVTLYAIQNEIIHHGEIKEAELIDQLGEINISFNYNRTTGDSDTFLNGENVEHEIRTLEIASWVSPVSAIKEVRDKLVALQKKFGKDKGVVMDGRDIGTKVFPDAELKIFMIASKEVRAYRRFRELINRGDQITLEDVKKNIEKRDNIDTTRVESPLTKAEDALILDNSILTMEEQFDIVQDWAEGKMNSKG